MDLVNKFEFVPNQEDYELGDPCLGDRCALARTIIRNLGLNALPRKVAVTWIRNKIVLGKENDEYKWLEENALEIYPLESAADFVKNFDSGKVVDLNQTFYINKSREEILEFLGFGKEDDSNMD